MGKNSKKQWNQKGSSHRHKNSHSCLEEEDFSFNDSFDRNPTSPHCSTDDENQEEEHEVQNDPENLPYSIDNDSIPSKFSLYQQSVQVCLYFCLFLVDPEPLI